MGDVKETSATSDEAGTCVLCRSSKKDDIQFGDFLSNKKGIGVHTFCLYASSNLQQNGEDDEGFLGFLETDINKEVRRISKLNCCYCGKAYANVGCCEPRCRHTFHFACGLEHGAENRYAKSYQSFCHRHVRRVSYRPNPNELCAICFDRLRGKSEHFSAVRMLRAPCCRNGWFHKLCLQHFAKTSGYFFKCPLCNDSKKFCEKLSNRGIFILHQDAAWELEPNAYSELLERPSSCAADRCRNRKGRDAHSDGNPFVMCTTCGSMAVHKLCLTNGSTFQCADCRNMLGVDGSLQSNGNEENNNEEDVEVDVCSINDEDKGSATVRCERAKVIKNSEMEERWSSSDTEEDQLIMSSSRKRFLIISDDSEESQSAALPPSSKRPKEQSETREVLVSEEEDDLELRNLSCPNRNARRILVSDDEEEEECKKEKENENRSNNWNLTKSLAFDCDSDDSDPLENFLELSAKQKAERESYQNRINREDRLNQNKPKTPETEMMTNRKPNVLDVSCIGQRTRRKSQYGRQEIIGESHAEDEIMNTGHNNLDISCIAVRTRQRTSRSAVGGHKGQNPKRLFDSESEQEMGEKGEEKSKKPNSDAEDRSSIASSSSSSSSTIRSSRNTYVTKYFRKLVTNQKPTSLNTSCIANRTRKRLSLKSSLPQISEEIARIDSATKSNKSNVDNQNSNSYLSMYSNAATTSSSSSSASSSSSSSSASSSSSSSSASSSSSSSSASSAGYKQQEAISRVSKRHNILATSDEEGEEVFVQSLSRPASIPSQQTHNRRTISSSSSSSSNSSNCAFGSSYCYARSKDFSQPYAAKMPCQDRFTAFMKSSFKRTNHKLKQQQNERTC